MTRNKLEQKLIEVALLPLKAVIAVAVVLFTRYDIEIREDPDRIGYYAVPRKRLNTCPLGCKHSEGAKV